MPKFHSNNDVQIRLDTVWQNITKSDIIFYQKTLKYFNDFQNRNFTVLWTQTMEIKQNQTFFHGANSLWHHLFLLKKYSIISMTFKIKISQFLTTLNPNNRNETKSDIFSWEIFKSDIIFRCSQNTQISKWLL